MEGRRERRRERRERKEEGIQGREKGNAGESEGGRNNGRKEKKEEGEKGKEEGELLYLSAKKPVIWPAMVPAMVANEPIQATLEKNSSRECTTTRLLNVESGESTARTIPITDAKALHGEHE